MEGRCKKCNRLIYDTEKLENIPVRVECQHCHSVNVISRIARGLEPKRRAKPKKITKETKVKVAEAKVTKPPAAPAETELESVVAPAENELELAESPAEPEAKETASPPKEGG